MSIRNAWPLTRMMWLLLFLCCPKGSPQGAVYFSDTFFPVRGINTCIIDQKRECCLTKATPHVGLTHRCAGGLRESAYPIILTRENISLTLVSFSTTFLHIFPEKLKMLSATASDSLVPFQCQLASLACNCHLSVAPGPVPNGWFVTDTHSYSSQKHHMAIHTGLQCSLLERE